MYFEVDGWNNFCRIFELPAAYPSDFCMPAIPVNFNMVDWFNPIQDLPVPAVSKELWVEKVGEIEVKKIDIKTLQISLLSFLKGKQYVKQGRQYLVLTDFGASFTFEADPQ